ncbi:MAG TPA: hypothetical protein VFE62_15210 [Gemmataceae bacterium]|nr:hypothetical protein [Gemmataceae bacterium]
MTSDDIIKDKAKPLAETVCRQKEYLYRLKTRLAAVGIPHDDKLAEKVEAAYKAIFELWLNLHYRSCGMAPKKTT